jgi:F-type H+-transporting ATPase subunit b
MAAVEVNATIFVQIFIFLMLLMWLSPTLFAPVLRLFEERERRIVGAREDAVKMTDLALEKANTFDSEYSKARLAAREALADLKRQADLESSQVIEQAKLKARQKLELAQKDLAKQEAMVRQELSSASDAIAKDIVNSLLSAKA